MRSSEAGLFSLPARPFPKTCRRNVCSVLLSSTHKYDWCWHLELTLAESENLIRLGEWGRPRSGCYPEDDNPCHHMGYQIDPEALLVKVVSFSQNLLVAAKPNSQYLCK